VIRTQLYDYKYSFRPNTLHMYHVEAEKYLKNMLIQKKKVWIVFLTFL